MDSLQIVVLFNSTEINCFYLQKNTTGKFDNVEQKLIVLQKKVIDSQEGSDKYELGSAIEEALISIDEYNGLPTDGTKRSAAERKVNRHLKAVKKAESKM